MKQVSKRSTKPSVVDPEEIPGTGALCPEAQADGVPCTELGKDCAVCGKSPVDKSRIEPREDEDELPDEECAGWGV